jgi:hypothetical protein
MTPFEIDGRQYRARPFDSDVHIELLLRLSPVFAALAASGPSLLGARQRHKAAEQPDPLNLLADLAAASNATADRLAALDRSGDAKVVISACLQSADQIVDGKPHPVMTRAGSISNMVDNGTWIAKLKITLRVVFINFGPLLTNMGVDVKDLMGDTSSDAV